MTKEFEMVWTRFFKIILYSLAIVSMNCRVVLAQKTANIWYFGNKAGLDFNSGEPVPLLDGQMNVEEGCASIADDNGDLLFYTDAETVWNKNHQVMGTGLNGGQSSSQACVIVPKPGSNTTYYIFTNEGLGGQGPNGFQYTEIDLSNGLGTIVNKNVPLVQPTTEKVTYASNRNGIDYWVIMHKWDSDEFHAYSVTSSGVSANAVVSKVGPQHNGLNGLFSFQGCMKVSPNGKLLAIVNTDMNLYDFNDSTGVVSNYRVVKEGQNSFSNYSTYYGVEFSPSSRFLYFTSWNASVTSGAGIYQCDLLNMNGTNQGLTRLDTTGNGSLQMGPDRKIYMTTNTTNLNIINYPDSLGLDCDYQVGTVDLGGRSSIIGLPQFFAPRFEVETNPQDTVYPDIDFNNVFSPNGDGLNDLFSFETVNLNEMDIAIYNRWGAKVFETTDLNSFWDGNASGGSPVGAGTYFYTFNGVYKNEQLINKKGSITLVR